MLLSHVGHAAVVVSLFGQDGWSEVLKLFENGDDNRADLPVWFLDHEGGQGNGSLGGTQCD